MIDLGLISEVKQMIISSQNCFPDTQKANDVLKWDFLLTGKSFVPPVYLFIWENIGTFLAFKKNPKQNIFLLKEHSNVEYQLIIHNWKTGQNKN